MRTVALLLLVAASGWFFQYASQKTRPVHLNIEYRLIQHPEFIPKVEDVRLIASGFDNVIADFYWLSAIQYVGENAVSSEYKRFLYEMLSLVTDLNPAFTTPYEVGLLLLPDINPSAEKFNKTEADMNVQKAVWLWEKGMRTTCDAKKVEKILAEPVLSKVWTDPQYESPCSNSMVPYYLAYVEYYNRKNADKASDYYRIAAASKDAPTGARMMSAIMKGKSGGREKSILMFLSIAESLQPGQASAEACRTVSREMRDYLVKPFSSEFQGEIPTEFVKLAEAYRAEATKGLKEDAAKAESMDALCSTYLGKAMRELNLEYIARKDATFVKNTGKQVIDAKELHDLGGLDYLPRDYQKLDDGLEIIYVKDDGKWDYVGGTY